MREAPPFCLTMGIVCYCTSTLLYDGSKLASSQQALSTVLYPYTEPGFGRPWGAGHGALPMERGHGCHPERCGWLAAGCRSSISGIHHPYPGASGPPFSSAVARGSGYDWDLPYCSLRYRQESDGQQRHQPRQALTAAESSAVIRSGTAMTGVWPAVAEGGTIDCSPLDIESGDAAALTTALYLYVCTVQYVVQRCRHDRQNATGSALRDYVLTPSVTRCYRGTCPLSRYTSCGEGKGVQHRVGSGGEQAAPCHWPAAGLSVTMVLDGQCLPRANSFALAEHRCCPEPSTFAPCGKVVLWYLDRRAGTSGRA